ncbi:MAG: NAD(P)/FAD-dependent oxidoreductase [Ilumatobacteraceae bacterium]
MVVKNAELLSAHDDLIKDAVQYADPMVLRGLLYQLTGNEDVIATKTTSSVIDGITFTAVVDEQSLAFLRAEAARLLMRLRDEGPGEVMPGPKERLHTSMSATAGESIRDADVDMYLERLALDPWALGLDSSVELPHDASNSFRVAVIGAGMAGLGVGVHLRRAGIPFFILEKGSGVGGVWFWNRYPGARVDVASRSYTHTFAADYLQASEHAAQSENERYFNWVADTFEVRPRIEFNTEVISVVWDDAASEWEITAQQPDGRRVFRANVVVSAVGIFSHPNMPDIEGLDDFKGRVFHSARWPADLEVADKKIAIIGSGCSAYQMAPVLAQETKQITMFQRTPSWVNGVPRYLDEMLPQVAWLDRNLPYHVNFARLRATWHARPESFYVQFTADPDYRGDPSAASEANKQRRDRLITWMRTKFADRPDLVEKMIPPYPPGAARPVLVDADNSVYDVLNRGDMSLVTDPIERISERGVVAGGVEYEADIVVLATGFRVNDFLWKMDVRGRDGATVTELWSEDGARAYLGTLLPGFPNFFMLYGPNTNGVGGFAILEFEEIVTRFIMQCVAKLATGAATTVEVAADAYSRFNEEQDRADALKIYNFDPSVRTYYTVGTKTNRRSITNSALDIRLLWHWLRDPNADPSVSERPRIDDLLAQIDVGLAASSRVAEPFFGKDLVLG